MSFLDPEQLICARLLQRVQQLDEAEAWPTRVPKVLTAADAANVEEQSQLAPAYYVVLESYAPTQEVGRGGVQQIEQQWVIYVVVRNAQGHASGQGVRDDAKQMIDVVLAALCGWRPSAEFTPLLMGTDTGPIYSDAGYGYFPVRFSTRCVVRGA